MPPSAPKQPAVEPVHGLHAQDVVRGVELVENVVAAHKLVAVVVHLVAFAFHRAVREHHARRPSLFDPVHALPGHIVPHLHAVGPSAVRCENAQVENSAR